MMDERFADVLMAGLKRSETWLNAPYQRSVTSYR
jgi:hypothetical protein